MSAKCSPEKRAERLSKARERFNEQVQDTISELASISFGEFLPTIYTFISQLSAGVATSYGAFLSNIITRGTVGNFISMVSLSLNMFNGSNIVLKYLAAKELEKALSRRIQISRALQQDSLQLLNILIAFRDLGINTDQALLVEIERALPHVKKAAKIVGQEKSKIQNTSRITITNDPIDNLRLNTAIKNIDQAIGYLSGGHLRGQDHVRALDELNQKYNLTIFSGSNFASEIGILDPRAIIFYFEDSFSKIVEQHSSRGQLSQKGSQVLKKYVIDFVKTPGINDFIRTYAATRFLSNYVSSIGSRLPIDGVTARDFIFDKTSISENPLSRVFSQGGEALDSLYSSLGIKPRRVISDYPETGTLASISTEVRLAESSILSLPA